MTTQQVVETRAEKKGEKAEKAEKQQFEQLLESGMGELMGILQGFLKEHGRDLSDSDVRKVWSKMNPERQKAFLYSSGLVPEPGVIGAILGWHDVQHLLSRGAGNKVAGIWGLATKSVAVGVAVMALLGRVDVRWGGNPQ